MSIFIEKIKLFPDRELKKGDFYFIYTKKMLCDLGIKTLFYT